MLSLSEACKFFLSVFHVNMSSRPTQHHGLFARDLAGMGESAQIHITGQVCLSAVCVRVCIWVCAWGQRSMLAVFSHSPPYFWRQGLPLNLQLTYLASLAGQQALGILLSLPPSARVARIPPSHVPSFSYGCPTVRTQTLKPVCLVNHLPSHNKSIKKLLSILVVWMRNVPNSVPIWWCLWEG